MEIKAEYGMDEYTYHHYKTAINKQMKKLQLFPYNKHYKQEDTSTSSQWLGQNNIFPPFLSFLYKRQVSSVPETSHLSWSTHYVALGSWSCYSCTLLVSVHRKKFQPGKIYGLKCKLTCNSNVRIGCGRYNSTGRSSIS